MDDRSALMAAIIHQPDEDTPRLVFADWLQEHGDTHDQARAEFIRLQIAERRAPNSRAAKKLADRAATLHKRHVRHWLGPLARLSGHLPGELFHRGLLLRWGLNAGSFLRKAHQAAVCEQFPRLGIECLALFENTKRVKALANSPALAWVIAFLWNDARLEDDGFEALAASPHLSRLTHLTIDKPRCTDAGLKALARSKGLPNLRSLGLPDGLWGGKFNAIGVRQILDSDRLPKLDELDLPGAHLHAVTHRTFWTYKNLSRLRVLRVGFDNDMKALAKCPHLTNLEELHVADSTLEDADAHVLADNPAFAKLKVLALTGMNSSRPPLGPEAEKALRDRFGDRLMLKYSVLCRRP
jgi:uncharacterized protein (TIGR02996 family)